MKKLFLFVGLFCLAGSQLDAAAKKGKKGKEDKLTEFFEMIPKAFVLQSGAKIDQGNFGNAKDKIFDKIMETCSKEMQEQIVFLSTVNAVKTQGGDFLADILKGTKKDLIRITEAELFAAITFDNQSTTPLFLILVFLSSLHNQQAKNVQAFLKNLFESEASGKTTLLSEKWKEKENGQTLLQLVIDSVIRSKQEAFLFPLFAKLIEKKKIKPEEYIIVPYVNFSFTQSLFEWMVSKYLDFFNHLSTEKREIGEAREVIDAYEQLLDQVIDPNISKDRLAEIVDGINIQSFGKDQEQRFKLRKKAMISLYKKIMKKQFNVFNVESLNSLLGQLMYVLGKEEDQQDKEYIKNLFDLVDKAIGYINTLPKNQNQSEYSQMLRSIIKDGYCRSYAYGPQLQGRNNQALVNKVKDLIDEFVTLGANINYVSAQGSQDEFPFNQNSLLYYAVKEDVKSIWDFLVEKGAKFTDEEKEKDPQVYEKFQASLPNS